MPGPLQGNYGPFKYDEDKRYIYPMFQRAHAAVGTDINDAMSALQKQALRLAEFGVGTGSPNDGFKIIQSALPTNNFTIMGGDGTLDGAGRLFVGGFQLLLKSNVEYTASSRDIHPQSYQVFEEYLIDSSANWTVDEFVGHLLMPDIATPGNTYLIVSNTATRINVTPGSTMVADGAHSGDHYQVNLTTPVAPRTDEVFVDVFVDEITETEDPTLIHTHIVPPGVSAYRAQVRQNVWVKEGGTTPTSPFTDADTRVHYYYKIATLARLAGDATITTAMITDERAKFNPGGGGVVIKEIDGSPSINLNELRVTNTSLTDLGGGIAEMNLNNVTVEEADGLPTVTHVNRIVVSNGTMTSLGGGAVQIETGGGTTGPISKTVPDCQNISGVPAPAIGTVGTYIESLDFPNGSISGQKFTFWVPEDYDSGAIDILVVYKPKTGVAAPNNVIRLETSGEIADISGGNVDTIVAVESDLTLPDAATTIVRSTIKTIAEGDFGIGDSIIFNLKRLGTHPNDTYTDDWQLIDFQFRYTGQIQTRSLTMPVDEFTNTDEAPPAAGTIGTAIDTLDFAIDEEQKCIFTVSDSWDGSSDVSVRVDYAMSSAEASKNVLLATEAEIANIDAGTVDTLAVTEFYLHPLNEMDAPRRSIAILTIPATSLHIGDQVTLKLARRAAVASEHGGDFRLLMVTFTTGVAPVSGFTEVKVTDGYLDFAGFGTAIGTISGDINYPTYADPEYFERYWKISSTSAGATLPISFAGRLGATQTKIDNIKLPIKGTAGAQYQTRVYAEGSGAVAVYDSGTQAAPTSRTLFTINDADLSAQPTGELRYFVDVLATLDNGEDLYIGCPFAKQE